MTCDLKDKIVHSSLREMLGIKRSTAVSVFRTDQFGASRYSNKQYHFKNRRVHRNAVLYGNCSVIRLLGIAHVYLIEIGLCIFGLTDDHLFRVLHYTKQEGRDKNEKNIYDKFLHVRYGDESGLDRHEIYLSNLEENLEWLEHAR